MKIILVFLLLPLIATSQWKEYIVNEELKKANDNNKGIKYKIDSIETTDTRWIVYYKPRSIKVSLFIGPENTLLWSKKRPAKKTSKPNKSQN